MARSETIVVGAGVAGLACAQALVAAGRDVVVLERARGVGGRCASKRFEDQPVDFGPVCLHGSDPTFLAALAAVPGVTALTDWPRRVEGRGAACQPDTFAPKERRLALQEGVVAFPRHLAHGLTVRTSTTVRSLQTTADAVEVHTQAGERFLARDLVLALALEQTQTLLASFETAPASLAGVKALLALFHSVPSLALIVGYDLDTPEPPWDVHYPEDSDALQLIAHDSAKRAAPNARVLVVQARPRWSRERLGQPVEQWSAALLDEAAQRLGPWAARPRFLHPHRWQYARLERGDELAQPVLSTLTAGGQRLGLAGDLFSPGGGVQAAWLSGRRLAHRLLQEPS